MKAAADLQLSGRSERQIAEDLARRAPRNPEAIAYLERTQNQATKKDGEN